MILLYKFKKISEEIAFDEMRSDESQIQRIKSDSDVYEKNNQMKIERGIVIYVFGKSL